MLLHANTILGDILSNIWSFLHLAWLPLHSLTRSHPEPGLFVLGFFTRITPWQINERQIKDLSISKSDGEGRIEVCFCTGVSSCLLHLCCVRCKHCMQHPAQDSLDKSIYRCWVCPAHAAGQYWLSMSPHPIRLRKCKNGSGLNTWLPYKRCISQHWFARSVSVVLLL